MRITLTFFWKNLLVFFINFVLAPTRDNGMRAWQIYDTLKIASKFNRCDKSIEVFQNSNTFMITIFVHPPRDVIDLKNRINNSIDHAVVILWNFLQNSKFY